MRYVLAILSFEKLKAVRDCTDLWHQTYPDAVVDDAVVAYKYFANPWAFDEPLRVLCDSYGPVTSMGYSALPIARGDRRFLAGQGGDAMSLPGRGGLNFAHLCKDEAAFLRGQGADMHLGSPNENSLPFVLRFGGRVVARLEYMQREPGRDPVVLGRDVPSFDVEISPHVAFSPEDYEAIGRCSDVYRVERSPEYYQWRFADQRDKHFEYAYARDEHGALLGYAFYALRSWGVCEMVDWDLLCDESHAASCMQRMCNAIEERHCRPLFVPCLNRATGETRLFSSLGFSTVQDASGETMVLDFTVKPTREGLPEDLFNEESWKLTLSDFDHFMN